MSGAYRAAIRRLRNGVVPSWEFELLSVGYDQPVQVIGKATRTLRESGSVPPLYVQGEWGTGKTHFLSFLRVHAVKDGFATAAVDLNAWSLALSYPQRFLPTVAESFRRGSSRGLLPVIVDLLHDDANRRALKSFANSGQAGDLYWPLLSLCREYEDGDRLELGSHWAWWTLYGKDLSWSDHSSKREKALTRIRSLAGMCRAIDGGGLILILDEAETIDQLWNVRSRAKAYTVLEALSTMNALWCVLGTTQRFDLAIDRDLDHPSIIEPEAVQFLRRWRSGSRNIIEAPSIDAKLATELATGVSLLYESAYGRIKGGDAVVQKCVHEWSRSPTRNPRRLIRSLIDRFDALRECAPE